MSLIHTAVGLLAISSPIGLLPVVVQAGRGNPVRIRRISRLAVFTFLCALIAACWLAPAPFPWWWPMPLRQALGELQEKAISRLMGLLLSAIVVQMLVSGLRGCFPVLA
jgi:small neutral amino acid transporter SnatA (MarC family)